MSGVKKEKKKARKMSICLPRLPTKFRPAVNVICAAYTNRVLEPGSTHSVMPMHHF